MIVESLNEKKQVFNSNATLFCLCITACCLSAPLNGLSPSLSLVAQDFNFNEKERDIYLGSYMGLSTMLGQMIGSCLSGFLSDIYSRKSILVLTLMIGSITTALFGVYFVSYQVLLCLRVFTGGCQGAVVPVLFSLIGDYYKLENRASASAVVSSCLGGGMMMGQLFAGFCLSSLGWRFPFLVLGAASLAAAISLQVTLVDPQKGANEEVLSELLSKGISLPPMTCSTFLRNLFIPTVFLMILQTLPNTVPWGVLSTHLHDLLATDAQLSMQQATSLIAVFGVGAALGGVFGGLLGARMYAMNKMFLPIFMGVTLASSAVLMKELLSMDLNEPGGMQLACPVLILSGSLAAVNGANIRFVVLNLTSPESRGASIAFLNFVNCIGRGFGPAIIEVWMTQHRLNRREALTTILNLWLISGTLLCLSSLTITHDEDKLRSSLRIYADAAISNSKRSGMPSK
jgi:MFS family permease